MLDRALLWLAPALGAALLVGCATTAGNFVWADEYKDAPSAQAEYVMAPGDLIWVRVFNQDGMSAKGKIRADGKLAVPFLNDVQAAGFTPNILAAQIQSRLKDFINTPQVTVSVEELRGATISVLGEVTRPGLVSTEAGAGVLQVLAASGGLTDYGHRDRIYVLRKGEKLERIRFDLDELYRGEGRASHFQMRAGDVLVVE